MASVNCSFDEEYLEIYLVTIVSSSMRQKDVVSYNIRFNG